MGISLKKLTMKFAVFAVVLVVFGTSHAMPQYGNNFGTYNPFGGQQVRQQQPPQQYQQQQPNFDFSQFLQYLDPALLAESQGLVLKTVGRTNELIDGLPPMTETAAQMAALWDIAYPQLSGLLAKAGKWADKVAVPA